MLSSKTVHPPIAAAVGSRDSNRGGRRGRPRRRPAPHPPGWTLLYSENFTAAINTGNAPWVRETYAHPFDTIMDDTGQWYRNDYGPAWTTAFNSFATYRKEFQVGQSGWLTASLSARDWNKDGVIESPPSITTASVGGRARRC